MDSVLLKPYVVLPAQVQTPDARLHVNPALMRQPSSVRSSEGSHGSLPPGFGLPPRATDRSAARHAATVEQGSAGMVKGTVYEAACFVNNRSCRLHMQESDLSLRSEADSLPIFSFIAPSDDHS